MRNENCAFFLFLLKIVVMKFRYFKELNYKNLLISNLNNSG